MAEKYYRKITDFYDSSKFELCEKPSHTTLENPVSTCGVLFYRFNKGNLQLLLTKYRDEKWPNLDDFGGRIDKEDDDLIDTAIRETCEETNKLILLERYELEKIKLFYNSSYKFATFLVQVNNNNTFFDNCDVFGDKEFSEDIFWHNFNSNFQKKETFIKIT